MRLLALLCLFLCSFPFCRASCPTDTICDKEFDRCYKFVDDEQDFFSAEAACISSGGHLVSIRNAFEKTIIEDTAESMFGDSTHYWIGANHILNDSWTWTDATPWQYTNWSPEQPTSLQAVGVSIGRGLWDSEDKITRSPFVCGLPYSAPETSSCPVCPVCPTTSLLSTVAACPTMPAPIPSPPRAMCEDGWMHYGVTKACYKIVRHLTFAGAEQKCGSFGGHLASIHSPEENAYITEFATSGNTLDLLDQTWIGMYRSGNSFAWTDGSEADYFNWAHNEPNDQGGTEACVKIWSDYSPSETYYGQWDDTGCDEHDRVGVCKKPEQQ